MPKEISQDFKGKLVVQILGSEIERGRMGMVIETSKDGGGKAHCRVQRDEGDFWCAASKLEEL